MGIVKDAQFSLNLTYFLPLMEGIKTTGKNNTLTTKFYGKESMRQIMSNMIAHIALMLALLDRLKQRTDLAGKFSV